MHVGMQCKLMGPLEACFWKQEKKDLQKEVAAKEQL